jgi:predicted tellurium resistance membrane protein TerC
MDWLGPHGVAILLTIIVINLTLSGDNAVAMAASGSNPVLRQRVCAAIIAVTVVGAAQIVVATAIMRLLALPVVGLLGAAFLVYRAVKLTLAEQPASRPVREADGETGFALMVLKVTFANLVTSGDNILAVAAVSEGREDLIVIGLMICLPIIVFGSMTIIYFLTRYPFIILVVAARLGYVAGGMGVEDPLWANLLEAHNRLSVSASSMLMAAVLVVLGVWSMFVRRFALRLAGARGGWNSRKRQSDIE